MASSSSMMMNNANHDDEYIDSQHNITSPNEDDSDAHLSPLQEIERYPGLDGAPVRCKLVPLIVVAVVDDDEHRVRCTLLIVC